MAPQRPPLESLRGVVFVGVVSLVVVGVALGLAQLPPGPPVPLVVVLLVLLLLVGFLSWLGRMWYREARDEGRSRARALLSTGRRVLDFVVFRDY